MSPSIGEEQLANAATAAISNSTGNIMMAILDGAESYSSKMFSLFQYLEKAASAKSSDELIETMSDCLACQEPWPIVRR
jgi:hypothetical protein